jgi:hypothetical protein
MLVAAALRAQTVLLVEQGAVGIAAVLPAAVEVEVDEQPGASWLASRACYKALVTSSSGIGRVLATRPPGG